MTGVARTTTDFVPNTKGGHVLKHEPSFEDDGLTRGQRVLDMQSVRARWDELRRWKLVLNNRWDGGGTYKAVPASADRRVKKLSAQPASQKGYQVLSTTQVYGYWTSLLRGKQQESDSEVESEENIRLLEQEAAMKDDGKKIVSRDPKGAEALIDSDDEQRRASVAKITRVSSILTVLVSGLALFSDGYNAQVIGYMNPVLKELYPDTYTATFKTRMSNSYLIGEIVGMLGFGYLIDKIGRRTGIVFATLLLILGVVIATASHGTSTRGMFWMMIIGRGLAGVGAGGEYPTCATGSAEASDESAYVKKKRGFLVAIATDFSIDLGFVMAGVIVLIVLMCYHQRPSDGVWRVSFGLGFVLPSALLFFRLRMINSTQYRKHAMRRFPYWLVLKRYWKPMLGTSLAWFMYDFVTYPFGIFSSTIISQLNPNDSLVQNIGYGTVVNLFYLPGCIVGGLLMDGIGRKQTMTLGFFLWALLGFIIGGALNSIQNIFPLFVVLYGIFNSLGEMGPGVATFLCGAESFPTPVRGHFLGLAAAVGKAGAAIGTQVFSPIQDSFGDAQKGVRAVFLIGAAFALVGAVIAWTLIPDMGRDLEQEDARFRAYLAENGFQDTFGESLEAELRTTKFDI